jgi:hypothetical protein
MTKRIKTILFSSIGVALLAGAFLVLHLTRAPEDITEPTEPTEDVMAIRFVELEIDDVWHIAISNHLDNYIISSWKGDKRQDSFFVTELDERSDNIRYNNQALEAIAYSAATLSARSLVEENAQDLEQYGLAGVPDDNHVKVFYGDSETTVLSFIIGNETPVNDDLYFRFVESNDVYSVPAHRLEHFLRDRHFWVDRQAFPFYDSENTPTVERITVQRIDLDEPMIIESIPINPLDEIRTFNSHRLVSPVSIEIDQQKSMYFIFGIFGLTALEVTLINPDELDIELLGFNTPTCIAEVEFGEGSDRQVYTLTIGTNHQTSDGVTLGWYGMSSEAPDVLFFFSSASLPWLNTNPEHIMAEMFLTPYIYSVDRLIIQTEDTNLEFKIVGNSEDNSVFMNNSGDPLPTARRAAFGELYQFIVSIKGEELFDNGDSEPPHSDLLVRISYFYRDEARGSDVIELYRAANLKSDIRVNGNLLFKCRNLYTNRLLANIRAFVDGGEILQDW